MAYPKRCKETGELLKTIITVRLNKCFDKETGEVHDGPSEGKSEFKIPPKNPPRRMPNLAEKRHYSTLKSVIFLLLTLIIIYDHALGITLWLVIEGLAHMCSHHPNKCSSNCKRPLPLATYFSEFCTICQAQRRMQAVGKFQDRRYVQNISNILAS